MYSREEIKALTDTMLNMTAGVTAAKESFTLRSDVGNRVQHLARLADDSHQEDHGWRGVRVKT